MQYIHSIITDTSNVNIELYDNWKRSLRSVARESTLIRESEYFRGVYATYLCLAHGAIAVICEKMLYCLQFTITQLIENILNRGSAAVCLS